MSKKLYVGNLPYGVDDEKLGTFFEQVGEVVSSKVVKDFTSGRSKGFGFVEMATEELGKTAISTMDGKDFDGRNIKVNEAKPKA